MEGEVLGYDILLNRLYALLYTARVTYNGLHYAFIVSKT